jgi:CRP/FNR family transcriptional regulator, anaerobic regulatory protein
MLARLDAAARIAALYLDVYDRLQRRGLANKRSFGLPLTQEQIADYLGLTLVHVNWTFRRMREEGLACNDRQTITLLDVDGLRGLVRGLPEPEGHPPELGKA